jgi:peroxiredoxin
LLLGGLSMISCGASSGQERSVGERLVGVELRSLVLEDCWKASLDLAMFARAYPVVLYFFSGDGGCPEGDEHGAVMDALQHRAFRDQLPDLEARGYTPVGVGSQPEQEQRDAAHANGLLHRLLCDQELQLARALELPTFSRDRVERYQRLMLVASEGRIVKAFYPCRQRGAQCRAGAHVVDRARSCSGWERSRG